MLAVTVAVFTNLALFLAVLPVQVSRMGGSRLEVGEATSLFSAGTVACELLVAVLSTRVSMAWLLAIGTFVMGAGTSGYLLAGGSIPLLLVLTSVRGGAFGVIVVTTSYLIAAYAPPAERGRALGVYGLAVSVPAIFGTSLGLVVQSAQGPGVLYVLGGVLALLAGVSFGVHILRRPPTAVTPPRFHPPALPRLLPVAAVIALITMTYGAWASFGPALVAAGGTGAAPLLFLVFGVLRAASRPVAGLSVDRAGALPVSVVAALLLAAGCTVLGAWPHGAGLVAGAVLYGTGLGGIALGGAVFAVAAQTNGIGAVAVLMPLVGSLAWLTVTADWARLRRAPG